MLSGRQHPAKARPRHIEGPRPVGLSPGPMTAACTGSRPVSRWARSAGSRVGRRSSGKRKVPPAQRDSRSARDSTASDGKTAQDGCGQVVRVRRPGSDLLSDRCPRLDASDAVGGTRSSFRGPSACRQVPRAQRAVAHVSVGASAGSGGAASSIRAQQQVTRPPKTATAIKLTPSPVWWSGPNWRAGSSPPEIRQSSTARSVRVDGHGGAPSPG